MIRFQAFSFRSNAARASNASQNVVLRLVRCICSCAPQAWSLHMKERFNEATCGRVSDISPCRPAYGSSGSAAATVDSEGRPSDWMAYQLKWPEAAADKRGTA